MAFKIKKHYYKWAHGLSKRNGPPLGITIHNSGGAKATPDMVHSWHLANGWAGFGYHALIQKNGTITEGRPYNTVGSHCYGNNSWLGICFEGNYQQEKTMPAKQLAAGRWLVQKWLKANPGIPVKGHGSMPRNATDCPGRFFPMKALLKR